MAAFNEHAEVALEYLDPVRRGSKEGRNKRNTTDEGHEAKSRGQATMFVTFDERARDAKDHDSKKRLRGADSEVDFGAGGRHVALSLLWLRNFVVV
jgi:hypothetical protein